jgi:copper(I)-binding protein
VILSSRRIPLLRGSLVVAAAALVPAVAGCAAGANSPTLHWHQPTPGASVVIDNVIRLNNVFVLGPAPAATFPIGSSAGLFLAVSNDGRADQLVKITAPGTATSVLLPGNGISVGYQRTVLLQGPAPQVILQGLIRPLRGGQYVPMVFYFKRAGAVRLNVPVMPRAASYATFSPAPASPTPIPSATAKGGHKSRHGAPATPSPSPSG